MGSLLELPCGYWVISKPILYSCHLFFFILPCNKCIQQFYFFKATKCGILVNFLCIE